MHRQRHGKTELTKGWKILIGILLVVCVFAGGVYIDTFYGSGRISNYMTQMTKKKPVADKKSQLTEAMDIDGGSKTSMAIFGKKFMLCTKDGVKFYNSMGDQKWNDTFNMSSPAMVQEGNYVAVGDMSGKLLRVYSNEGMLYTLQAEGTLVQFALNEKGYLSLITKEADAYHVRVYNTKGTLLKERVEESSGIYPLSSDVADDGKVFAVSYLDTTDITPISRVLLFYINPEDSEDHTDSMFAAVEKPGELIPAIGYMNGGALAVISDENIYGVSGDGQEIWKYELENTIDQVSFGTKENIVVALGGGVADKDGRKKGTVCWIDSSGKEKASFESGESVTYLCAGKEGVVIGNNRDYTGLSNGGKAEWTYTATVDMGDLIPMEKLNRVMVISKETAAIVDMSKVESGEETVIPKDTTDEKEQPETKKDDSKAAQSEKEQAKQDSSSETTDQKDKTDAVKQTDQQKAAAQTTEIKESEKKKTETKGTARLTKKQKQEDSQKAEKTAEQKNDSAKPQETDQET